MFACLADKDQVVGEHRHQSMAGDLNQERMVSVHHGQAVLVCVHVQGAGHQPRIRGQRNSQANL